MTTRPTTPGRAKPSGATADGHAVRVRLSGARAPMNASPSRLVVQPVEVLPADGGGADLASAGQHRGPRKRAASIAQTERVSGLLLLGGKDDLAELADHLAPDDVPAAPVVLQARRNAAWRAEIADTYGLLTAAEVADLLGSTATNRGALASRLATAGAIFGVRYKSNRVLYPGFQFTADGAIHPAIQPLLSVLTAAVGGWELVSWFTSANDWLDGHAPVDRLDDLDDLRAAAEHEADVLGY